MNNSYQEEPIRKKQTPPGYDEDYNEVNLSLKNVWNAFKHYFWQIVLVTVLCGAGAFAFRYFTSAPEYKAQGMLYIQPKEYMVDENGAIGTFDKKIVSNARYLIQNDETLSKLLDNSSYDKLEELEENVEVVPYTEADMIDIAVMAPTAQEALDLCQFYMDEAVSLIKGEMDFVNVSAIQQPQLPETPESRGSMMFGALGAMAGLALSCLFVFVKGLNDHRMHDKAEVEEFLEKPVYGVLPKQPKKKEA